MQADEARAKIDEVKYWYHTIDVGHGIVTPGMKKCDDFDLLGLPDLRGKTVLDVGCWDGFYSFECEKRGAKRVLATDHFAWNSFGNDGLLAAREALGSKVEHKDIDVMDISPETVGTWDIVLFLGVLYHLQNPMSALEKLAHITKSLLVVESHVANIPLYNDVPLAAFYETDELNDDHTNWWGPNLNCMIQMVRSAGFPSVEVKRPEDKEKRAKLLGQSRGSKLRELRRFLTGNGRVRPGSARAVVHGWKKKLGE